MLRRGLPKPSSQPPKKARKGNCSPKFNSKVSWFLPMVAGEHQKSDSGTSDKHPKDDSQSLSDVSLMCGPSDARRAVRFIRIDDLSALGRSRHEYRPHRSPAVALVR